MGIFNEHSDNSFAKGIQGAPGVGFNLTSDGNYDMVNKKLKNVGAPSDNTDAATTVVCNYGLFQLILNVINRFGQ